MNAVMSAVLVLIALLGAPLFVVILAASMLGFYVGRYRSDGNYH